MNKILSVFIAIIITTFNSFGQDEVAKQILDKLSEKSKSYTDIYTKFNFNFSNSSQEIDENSEGEIWIKEDMYKLDMSSDLSIINNGETLWYFMKDVPEVQIMENDPDDEMNPSNIFTIYEKGYKYEYKGASSEGNKRVHSINLYPEKSGTIIKFTLNIDAEKTELTSIKLYDRDGGITTYTINKFVTNSGIPESTFIFKKKNHPGVEVIDLR
ncbi:MAG: outer membrane lipoprotein carrier protein LolA [Flavobacteriales bacterium]|nr:outer membrane lipoprotein carrier protein LolA [Flavobacteriales bacterium]